MCVCLRVRTYVRTYVCVCKADVIYSDTKAYVWPGAVGKACSLRYESLSCE